MKTKILLLLITALSFSATFRDVVPINWAGIDIKTPLTDSFAVKILQLHNTSLKYVLNNELDMLAMDSDSLFLLNYSSIEEYNIRGPAHAALSIAISLLTETYNESVTGQDTARAWRTLRKLVKSLAVRHKANGGTRWGYVWQSALWTHNAGMAGWLIWNQLDTTTQSYVANMVEREANRFNSNPPYCDNCTGDTKAEENAWNANVIALAASMMPTHSNISWWKMRASQWMISSYARESDLERENFIDGQKTKEWITGWNMREQGYVYNHDRIHPDYMVAAVHQLWSLLPIALSYKYIPQASLWNMDLVYWCLTDYSWSVPPYRSPGGTIYRKDSARVYYPEGTDWSPNRVSNFFSFDVFAGNLGMDRLSSLPASTWYIPRANHMIGMQARSTTGQIFIAGELNFDPKESMASYEFGSSYLTMLLKRNSLFTVGNWIYGTVDITPPSQPSNLHASTTDLGKALLSWEISTDNESGIEGYYIYRDGILVASSRTNTYTDEKVNFRLIPSAKYSVSAVNRFGIEGQLSPQITVSAPVDSSTLLVEHVMAANGNKITIVFTKAVDSATAAALSSYTLSELTVSNSSINTGRNVVVLTTSQMTANYGYNLTINSIRGHIDTSETLQGVNSFSFFYSQIDNNLAGYWPLNESTGGYIFDYSGNSLNGQLTGNYLRNSGRIDNAIHLVPGAYGNMGSVMQNLSFPFSIAMWVKMEGDSTRSLISTEDVAGNYYGAWMVAKGTGQIEVHIGNGGTPSPGSRMTKLSDSVITKNEWVHVCAVFSSVSDMTIYINGKDASGTYSGSASNMGHSDVGKLQIGYQTSAVTPILHYRGGIDEVRIYNKSLTITEITELAEAQSTKCETSFSMVSKAGLSVAPNPFNPTTSVSFNLTKTQKVSIYVLDIRGKIVLRLVDEVVKAGYNRYPLSGLNIASGIYTVLLRTAESSHERRVVLLK